MELTPSSRRIVQMYGFSKRALAEVDENIKLYDGSKTSPYHAPYIDMDQVIRLNNDKEIIKQGLRKGGTRRRRRSRRSRKFK